MKQYSNATSFLQLVVHEIRHNLGMGHDFIGVDLNAKRFAKKDKAPCTAVGGFMDYGKNANKWSPCSVEDFTTYYNNIMDFDKKFCLTLLASKAKKPNSGSASSDPTSSSASSDSSSGSASTDPASSDPGSIPADGDGTILIV